MSFKGFDTSYGGGAVDLAKFIPSEYQKYLPAVTPLAGEWWKQKKAAPVSSSTTQQKKTSTDQYKEALDLYNQQQLEYQKNPYTGYNPATEIVTTEGGQQVVVPRTAPTGVGRVFAGMVDAIPLFNTDWDQRGGGPNKWGELPTTGPGRLAQMKPMPLHPSQQNIDTGSAVPDLKRNILDRVINKAEVAFVDPMISQGRINQALDAGVYANRVAQQIDYENMMRYLATDRGQAEVALMRQQGAYMNQVGEAAKITARAQSQQAANEFGIGGLNRSMSGGYGAPVIRSIR